MGLVAIQALPSEFRRPGMLTGYSRTVKAPRDGLRPEVHRSPGRSLGELECRPRTVPAGPQAGPVVANQPAGHHPRRRPPGPGVARHRVQCVEQPGGSRPADPQRVLDAIDKTGFVRSTAAHQLRVGKSRTVGVVLLDIANPFFAEMVRGAEGVLRDKGYVLMVCSTDESVERERRYLRVLEEHRVDGLLDHTGRGRTCTRWRSWPARGIPTVLLDRDGGDHELCSATVDDVRGGELAAGHLFELGHGTVAFVNGPSSIRQCADRREGAHKALRRAGGDGRRRCER